MTQEYVKISQLDAVPSFSTTDQFVLVQNNETVKITGVNLIDSLTTLTNLATRSFVTAIVDSAPETLDTLKELAAALNDDANFASTITNLIATKLNTSNFGLKFWEELATVNTYHIAEGSNLYFTEQRVLDVLDSVPPPPPADRLVNDSIEVVLDGTGTLTIPNTIKTMDGMFFRAISDTSAEVSWQAANTPPNSPVYSGFVTNYFGAVIRNHSTDSSGEWTTVQWMFGHDGALTLPADPTSDNHAATKGYVDSQLNSIGIESDRLVAGEKEVVLQSNGYIRLVNGAQLYDYGSGAGNGYGITDSQGGTYIGYDPDDAGGALHMDSYNGKNIRIRTTPVGTSNYKDWLFDNAGVLSIPPGGDIKRNGVSVLGGGSSFSGSYNDLTNKPTAPTYTSVTTTQLNVQNVTFTGTGAVTFESGNDLNFVAAGAITFNGSEAITKTQLKSIVAAASDFADFKARIASL